METFGDRRAFLTEMFPSLSSKEVEQVLIKNPQRSLSDIVNLLLDAEELHRKESGRETRASADEDAYEMISLIPARTGSDEELVSGAEKNAEKQQQEQEDLIVLSDDDEDEKQTTPQEDFESAMLNTLHELFSQLETEVRHVQLQLQHEGGKSTGVTTSDGSPSVVLTLTTLLRLVDNVLQHPDEDKYRTVNLKNATVRARIGQFPAAIRILEEANFKWSPLDGCLKLESIDEQRLSLVRSWLLCFVDLPPPPVTPSPTAQSVPVPSAPPAPVRATAPTPTVNHERVLQPIHFRPDYRLPPREVLARLHEQRLTAKRKRPTTPLNVEPSSNENINPYYKGYVTRGGLPTTRNADFHKQLREYRSTQRSHEWQNTRQGRKRMYTIADLEAEDRARKYEAGWAPGAPPGTTGPGTNRTAVHTIENTFMDPQRIGLKALELTNKFRASQGRPPLIWNQALCQIGIEHSRRMADGVVPFGHDGFNQRVANFPFPVRSAAENVAMNQGLGAVAEVAVQGWIESPGHRKNLLGDFEVCGIGVYRSWNGSFYLTQLFAY
eukprot:GILJ01009520.1.p1 GENE.GILJ01009520.1~~GILJ01009520.1.p1  ORF type:complete len:552 (-),score=78.12 GILJ01009520.1:109-1764(-)